LALCKGEGNVAKKRGRLPDSKGNGKEGKKKVKPVGTSPRLLEKLVEKRARKGVYEACTRVPRTKKIACLVDVEVKGGGGVGFTVEGGREARRLLKEKRRILCVGS